MRPKDLLRTTTQGLYCEQGDFYIDPWRSVPRALITHGHSDHARWGCEKYLATPETAEIMRVRLGSGIQVRTTKMGETTSINGVKVSFHPAGHVLGSAQIRLEAKGQVWVVSGDYKREADRTCESFEPVRCHTFITESTFGLPIYQWPEQERTFAAINAWWKENAAAGITSIIFVYGLGKAQRLLAGLDESIGPIFCHGAVEKINQVYRQCGIALPKTQAVGSSRSAQDKKAWETGMVLAPPSAQGSGYTRKFGKQRTAFASGWMTVRGRRRQRNVDRGFVVSDHADWPGLLEAIAETGAERVFVTHGYQQTMVKYLREIGLEAHELSTEYGGEDDDIADEVTADVTDDSTSQTQEAS